MTTDNKKKWSFMQGITTHNPVFASGLAIAPAVFAGSTLSGALTYAAFFSAVTFTALFFSSLLPRRIPYALRIILYTAAAAAVYIPFYIYFDGRLPADAAKLGMFLPMIATSQFVVSASELRFFRMSRPSWGWDSPDTRQAARRSLWRVLSSRQGLPGETHCPSERC